MTEGFPLLHRARRTLERTPMRPFVPVITRAAKSVLVEARRLADPVWRENLRRLDRYRDRHKGERCFLIGNGPSLATMELGKLRHEVTFGLNRIYLMFDELGFKTTYLTVVNPLVIEQCADDFAALELPVFASLAAREHMAIGPNVHLLDTAAEEPTFARDPRRQLWEGATVTYVAMQLAYFMGFDEVILIGVDHHFPGASGPAHAEVVSEGPDLNHFSPNYFGKGFRWQLPDLECSELAYSIARLVYARDGRRIRNATVGGKLELFERVDFNSLF